MTPMGTFKRWFNVHLTVEQQQVLKIEEVTKPRHEIMDPAELAIDLLLGEMDPPFSSKEDPE